MINGNEIINVGREVWIQAANQNEFAANITGVEENIFWTALPRDSFQVLVMQKKQKVKVGISLQKGFYTGESVVIALGDGHDKFYGLTIPNKFNKTSYRKFVRAQYPANVSFSNGHLVVQTASVNFSAGGIMVYLVPDLDLMLQSNNEITTCFNIGGHNFQFNVEVVWSKNINNIPFAGFKFVNMDHHLQDELAELAIRCSKNQ